MGNVSCILTIHNKDFLIERVCQSLLNNLSNKTNQLIIVFDGCTDNSIPIVKNILKDIGDILSNNKLSFNYLNYSIK